LTRRPVPQTSASNDIDCRFLCLWRAWGAIGTIRPGWG